MLAIMQAKGGLHERLEEKERAEAESAHHRYLMVLESGFL
jgi:hypothetical protein